MNPLEVFTLFNELSFFLSGLKVSELFRLSWDGLMNPKTGVKRVQGVSLATFGSQTHFGAPAVSHYQNLPVNNETRQWDSRQAANTAHGSVLCCCSWWDNGALILYIQVNVLLSVVFFSMNLIKSQLSSLQGLKAPRTDNKTQTSGTQRWPNLQTYKVTFCFMRRLHSI